MENVEVDKITSSEDSSQLNRNRSFKSKQLVRSQAIRESQSPPRTVSPSVVIADPVDDDNKVDSDDVSTKCPDFDSQDKAEDEVKRQPVEIQITSGVWEEPPQSQRQRTKRWLGHSPHSRDLLSNNPRVACVCGTCNACPHCRGRRRKQLCPTKQDSGIACSEDCPDCSDTEHNGNTSLESRKANSVDVEEPTYYCRCPERREKPKTSSFSRTDSEDKSEPTGPELVSFLKETLNKNARDRMTLLKIEKELHALVNDTGRCIVRFPVMTSYGRMLVHRCAALFQLSHHLDHTNKTSVLVSKAGTSGGRIPCTSFKSWCTATFPPSPQRHPADCTNAKSILKRATHSLDETGGGSLTAARSKSLEQREREYERVRRRIFSTDNCNQDESQWQWLSTGPVKLLTPEGGRNKLLKVQSLEGAGTSAGPRGAVAKSHSFGGYGRAQDPPRLLSRQGDLASSSWRVSPSSSGYRTLSLHSADSVTPSPTGGASPEPCASVTEGAVVWCVTDLSCVPPGAVVIHPQTGRPLTNPDGSVYHFDPDNPPAISQDNAYDPKVDVNTKKRGRLEKQHSFIDSECECPSSDESRSKCCCECRRHDNCHRSSNNKITPQPEKVHQKPPSPCKNRYEPPIEPPTNHNLPPDVPANHRPAYDVSANQKPANEMTIQHQVYDVAQTYNPNYRPAFEYRTLFDPNQRTFEVQRPPSYDANQKYEQANHRAASEVTNQRPAKLTNQGSPEIQYVTQQYQQGYTHEEAMCMPVTSPIQPPYLPPEYNTMNVQLKPMGHDPNMRPMSLGMMYPPLPQYLSSPLPPYPAPQPVDHSQQHTFRIDPSYPYTPLECAQACGACAEPAARQYALYAPVDSTYPQAHPQYAEQPLQWAVLPPKMATGYPPLVLPPAPLVPVYTQMVPAPYNMCPPLYNPAMEQRPPSANVRQSKRNSLSGSSRNTPITSLPEEKSIRQVPYEENRLTPQQNTNIPNMQAQKHNMQNMQLQNTNMQNMQAQNANMQVQNTNMQQQNTNMQVQNTNMQVQNVNQHAQSSNRDSNEIAAKIQQIKEQMAQMNTRDRDRDREKRGREEWRRRNSGSGILGSYPQQQHNNYRRPPNEEAQLSSAARAIVHSIRNMQAKNTYQDRRPFHPSPNNGPPRRNDRTNMPVYHTSYLLRQMTPGTWCRRSPAPVHPVLDNPRKSQPDTRNGRR